MKVALCCIGRLENQYALEYVDYYKLIGFDKIFIYDNNHDGEEHFEDVLQSYIDDNFVEVINWRNNEAVQIKAYNDCYAKHNNEYDWIAFFDFDEFFTLTEGDIKSYLSNFSNCDVIKVNWMIYTDNNLVTNDGRPVLERFTEPMPYDKTFSYKFPENNHTKSIVRGGINNFRWSSGNPHVPGRNFSYVDSVGNKTNNTPFQPYNFRKAYIKHFSMKTIDEYINGKRRRGQGNRSYINFKSMYKIDNFFKLNEKTEEKMKYLENIK